MGEGGRGNGSRRSKEAAPVSLKRTILHAFQILLAFVLILVVLSFVQIRDQAVIPGGGPFAGKYNGRITRRGDVILFSASEGLSIEARYTEGTLRSASVMGPDRRVLELPPDRLSGLEIKEGLITILKKTDPVYYAEAFLIYIAAYLFSFIRWKLLLDAAGLSTSLATATRLSTVGLFFNNLVPGLTGGDLVKAFCIVREKGRNKTDAVITVIVDRVMGIVVLASFSAAAVLTDLDRYREVALSIYIFLAAALAAGIVFFSKRMRRLVFFDRFISFLPFNDLVRKVDRSVFLYRYRKRTIMACVLLTAGVHLGVILTLWTLGKGLSIDCPLIAYAVLVPIVLIVSALPITPAGWGVGEMSFVYFFAFAGVPAVLALALSFIHRFNTLLISLSGGAVLLFDRLHPGGEGPGCASHREGLSVTDRNAEQEPRQ